MAAVRTHTIGSRAASASTRRRPTSLPQEATAQATEGKKQHRVLAQVGVGLRRVRACWLLCGCMRRAAQRVPARSSWRTGGNRTGREPHAELQMTSPGRMTSPHASQHIGGFRSKQCQHCGCYGNVWSITFALTIAVDRRRNENASVKKFLCRSRRQAATRLPPR